eukprot:scaffold9150_cov22-Tisochrysis_lutea.AAC.1
MLTIVCTCEVRRMCKSKGKHSIKEVYNMCIYATGEEEAQEQKRLLDAQVAEAKARAQELKAMFDK